MAQRTRGLDGHPRSPDVLEREIETIRAELDRVASELDLRRHELTDLRLQMRRHPRAFAVAAGAGVAMVSGCIALLVRKHRSAHESVSKLQRLRAALARMIADPEAVAKPTPMVGKKVASAALGAVAATLGTRLAQRVTPRARA